jgi:hypothetical protein
MTRLKLLRLLIVAVTCTGSLSCGDNATGPGDNSGLVETHRAILDGRVEGNANEPLEKIEVIVDFEGESLTDPTTLTDGAGEFEFVLALYNAQGTGPDSVRATVYAIARTNSGTVEAITHQDVTIHFLPVAQDPPTTTVNFSLDIP